MRLSPVVPLVGASLIATALLVPAPAGAGQTGSSVIGAGYHTSFLIEKGVPIGAGLGERGQLTGGEGNRGLTLLSGLPDSVDAVGVTGCQAHTLVTGSNDVVYGTGANGDGQLTGADASDRTTLTPLTGLPGGVTPIGLACGDEISIVLGDDGVAYGSGLSQYGELTDIGKVTTLTPLTVPEGLRIEAVAAGSNHTVVLGDDGVVYGTGRNSDQQIAPTGAAFDRLTPIGGLPEGARPVAVAAGAGHSAVLTADGEVYLTKPPASPATGTWTKVPNALNIDITAIASRGDVTVGIDETGRAFGVGPNVKGVLTGIAGTVTDWRIFSGRPPGVNFIEIAAGIEHIVLLGSNDALYATGDNSELQHSPTDDFSNMPVPVHGQVLRLREPAIAEGVARVGRTLENDYRFAIPPTSITRAWTRDGVAIDGATDGTYELTAADLGARIRVVMTLSRPGFVGTDNTSSPTAVVARGKSPRYEGSDPIVKGKTKIGKVLRLKRHQPDAYEPETTRVRYQWFRGAKTVRGATGTTYRVTRADKGKTIKLVITAKRPGHLDGKLTIKRAVPR